MDGSRSEGHPRPVENSAEPSASGTGSRPPETGSGPTHRSSGRVLTHARPPCLRPVLDGSQPIPAAGPRTTRTTVVADDPGTDDVTTSALARHRRSSASAAAISSAADDPFIASSWPPSATRGIAHASSFGRAASARGGDHVETPPLGPLLRPLADHLDRLQAEPRRRPRRGRPPGEPSARPGSPADRGARSPGPARGGRRPSRGRPRWRPTGTRGASRPQLTRCRSHSAGTSRGPIRPRVTPSVARKSAYASSSGSRSGGKISRQDDRDREPAMFHVKRRPSRQARITT